MVKFILLDRQTDRLTRRMSQQCTSRCSLDNCCHKVDSFVVSLLVFNLEKVPIPSLYLK